MSVWRRKALEFLPQIKNEVELTTAVTDLWIEISNEFLSAVDRSDEGYVSGTLKYLAWSCSDVAGIESQQAVNCGFLEDITYNKKYWVLFSKWFSKEEFERFKGSFQYALSEKEFTQLSRVFYGF